MKRVATLFLAAAATCLMASCPETANADGWGYGSGGSWGNSSGGSWGSSGGSRGYASSGGSWGSSGGRYYASSGGSWGSSGGHYVGPIRRGLRRLHHRIHHHSSGGYSSGGRYYGSSGGSRGYYVSYGSSGGSSGGSSAGYYRTYSNPPIVNSYYPQQGVVLDGIVDPNADSPGENPGPGTDQQNSEPQNQGDGGGADGGMVDTSRIPIGDAWLNVSLPKEAKVYVNGRLTTTPGTQRQYVSRDLLAGESYTYEIRAELERDGKQVEQTKVVKLTAGSNKNLSFDFGETRELITSLTLDVPADAKVVLGGVPTSSVGPVRYYSTKELKAGESWQDYEVQVSVTRDGKTLTRTRKVNVAAGKSAKLAFSFDGAPVKTSVAVRKP